MTEVIDWKQVSKILNSLYANVEALETIFPGRKFTLDGHLVGSIGEVVAAYMFDLRLTPGSNKGYDALAPDGRAVEIKFTQGKTVGLRHCHDHVLILCKPKGTPLYVVYNGPGGLLWDAAGPVQKNGQRPIGISRAAGLDAEVTKEARLPKARNSPI